MPLPVYFTLLNVYAPGNEVPVGPKNNNNNNNNTLTSKAP